MAATQSTTERFWSKVDIRSDSECWTWQAYVGTHGYGMYKLCRARPDVAHRVAYRLAVGPIPDGLFVDHICRNKLCVNPAHLEPVTHVENMRRARRTHCKRGHLLDEQTLVIRGPHRSCKKCEQFREKHRIRDRRKVRVASRA